jgi:MFS transporter, PAT family, beta-lactamase induction signal transducer AmpG
LNLLATPRGRRLLFGLLYFSEGAPVGYIWWALPTRLRVAGVAIEEITALTSVLVLPWILKFLWAPLIDAFRSPSWDLRSWVLLAQLSMGLFILPLLFLDLELQFSLVVPLLLLHTFAAATQDVSVDALAISRIDAGERGSINGWMQMGMLAGRSILGGGGLILARTIGDQGVIALLLAAVWSSMIVLLIGTRPEGRADETPGFQPAFRMFRNHLQDAIRRRTTWLGLAFAGVGAAGFEAVGAVAGPFLVDVGLSEEQTGWFFAIPTVAGMMMGALLGGYLSDKLGRKKAVGLFLLLFVADIFLLSAFYQVSGSSAVPIIIGLLSVLYFCIGLFTSSSYALFMDLTDPRLGATQFSAYMGATNGCESWSAFTVGRLIAGFGYAPAFAIMGAVSLIALPVLHLLPASGRHSSRP